jgi:hypothetical protein
VIALARKLSFSFTFLSLFLHFLLSFRVSFAFVPENIFLKYFAGQYQSEWEAVIAQVRASFSGKLTYCSIMWPVETQQVVFWDSLDFISMDTYFPFWNGTGPVPYLDLMTEVIYKTLFH